MLNRDRLINASRPAFPILLSLVVWVALAPCSSLHADTLWITGVKIYPSPQAQPIELGAVLIREGVIADVTTSLPEEVKSDVEVVDGKGKTLTAGFWNSHVHFTPPVWSPPSEMGEQKLQGLLEEMLTSRGFTSVVNTGANPRWIAVLRERIEGGVPGPRILTAAGSFVGKDASPAYLDFKLPELETAEQARAVTAGAIEELRPQGIKIFSGSFVGPGEAAHMTLPVVKAVTETAHQQGVWVISHPQSLRGVELAVDGGVDVLAHTAPHAGRWPEALVHRAVERKVALIPTLKLWRYEAAKGPRTPGEIEAFQQAGVGQLRQFAEAGGEVLFGTDVGYMTLFETTEEFQKMSEAGLDYREILASLTTAPASRFVDESGTIAVGERADLVMLDGDPAVDPTAFARVEMTIRGGRIVFRAPASR